MALKYVLVVRHAESAEDVDPTLHNLSNDNDIALTESGCKQIGTIVRNLEKFTVGRSSCVFLSSSFRVGETHKRVTDQIPELGHLVKVDIRLRNLNWGSMTLENRHLIEAERYQVGVLNYHFPDGDDSALYIKRIGEFVEEIRSQADRHDYPEVIIIMTHGFATRVIVKHFCEMSDADFLWLANPPNACVVEIEKVGGNFKLLTEMPIFKFTQESGKSSF